MNLIEVMKPDFVFSDERGGLTQLVHEGYEQVNVLVSNKGVVRGGHYHKISKEAFYVISGKVEVTARFKDNVERCTFGEKTFFCINTNIIHSMSFPEDCVMVQMYDKCVEQKDGTKDIYSD